VREVEGGVVDFVKPGEKLYKKKRRAGKRVQEAKQSAGKSAAQAGGRGLQAGEGEVHTVDPGASARGGFFGKKKA